MSLEHTCKISRISNEASSFHDQKSKHGATNDMWKQTLAKYFFQPCTILIKTIKNQGHHKEHGEKNCIQFGWVFYDLWNFECWKKNEKWERKACESCKHVEINRKSQRRKCHQHGIEARDILKIGARKHLSHAQYTKNGSKSQFLEIFHIHTRVHTVHHSRTFCHQITQTIYHQKGLSMYIHNLKLI